ETLEIACFEEAAKGKFNAGSFPQRSHERPGFRIRCGYCIAVEVVLYQQVDRFVADLLCQCDEIADAITFHRESELNLRGDFVALGYCDMAHVVAEAGKTCTLPVMPCHRRPHPAIDLADCCRRLPVADDHFVLASQ